MIYIFGVLLLLIVAFFLYRVVNPRPDLSENPAITDSMAVVLPDVQAKTGRKVARWLPPCNGRTVGHCGSPLNCCGCLYPDTVS